jgi:hypothetical protein
MIIAYLYCVDAGSRVEVEEVEKIAVELYEWLQKTDSWLWRTCVLNEIVQREDLKSVLLAWGRPVIAENSVTFSLFYGLFRQICRDRWKARP